MLSGVDIYLGFQGSSGRWLIANKVVAGCSTLPLFFALGESFSSNVASHQQLLRAAAAALVESFTDLRFQQVGAIAYILTASVVFVQTDLNRKAGSMGIVLPCQFTDTHLLSFADFGVVPFLLAEIRCTLSLAARNHTQGPRKQRV